ncbi:hypothetical protein HK098_000307, partial [Nowakowskiella sp. JEL0407]
MSPPTEGTIREFRLKHPDASWNDFKLYCTGKIEGLTKVPELRRTDTAELKQLELCLRSKKIWDSIEPFKHWDKENNTPSGIDSANLLRIPTQKRDLTLDYTPDVPKKPKLTNLDSTSEIENSQIPQNVNASKSQDISEIDAVKRAVSK